MIMALQTMVTRSFDIFDPVVITVGTISGGTKRNIIPDTASFEATVRRFSEANEQRLGAAIKRTLEGVAAAHGVDVEIRFETEYPTTVNTAAEVEFAAGVVREVLGPERYRELPDPISGSEDFSRVLAEVPGAFLAIGATPPGRDPATAPMNHSPRADFDPTRAVRRGRRLRRLAARSRRRLGGDVVSQIPTAANQSRRPARSFGIGSGNAMEWFDWGVYTTFTPFFASQFFHSGDPVSDVLKTLIVFAVGFIARPFGGLLFGWIADKKGRKLSMTLTVALAAAGSLVIGLSPSYALIGVGASIILVLARLAQGLAHGGELPSAQTYIAEAAPRERRGLWSSLIYFSGTIGQLAGTLLAAILSTVLTQDAMTAYGWRIPFVLGGVFGLYALYMRLRMHETEVFVDEVVARRSRRAASGRRSRRTPSCCSRSSA